MDARRTLTIGATVNLEHYENLRLEVTGEVESPEDADALAEFLDAILAKMGRGDPATAERVDSYRKRVLRKIPQNAAVSGTGCHDGIAPLPDTLRKQMADEGMQPAAGGQAAPLLPDPAPAPATSGKTPPGRIPPSSEPAATPGVVCDACGIPISVPEQKMSLLFTSRALCRACMKKE